MSTYLSMRMPSQRKRSHYSLMQKLIKQNWPNTTAIKNIRGHVEDVPRKLLLLLYVVTEDSGCTDGSTGSWTRTTSPWRSGWRTTGGP